LNVLFLVNKNPPPYNLIITTSDIRLIVYMARYTARSYILWTILTRPELEWRGLAEIYAAEWDILSQLELPTLFQADNDWYEEFRGDRPENTSSDGNLANLLWACCWLNGENGVSTFRPRRYTSTAANVAARRWIVRQYRGQPLPPEPRFI
jgi:hypothetical protein